MNLDIFIFEFKHFTRSKAKLFSYLLFMCLCVFSIYNGFEIMHKQIDTINEINFKQESEISQLKEWFDKEVKGPKDKPWVSIDDPYW